MKQVLSIQDLSCVGKCSLTVALPVLSAMGCVCTPLPTGILSSHTAFPNPHIRSLTEDIAPTCRHWQEIGASFDMISVGYLSDPQQANAVRRVLDAFPARVVLDPVLGDNGNCYRGIGEDHIAAMKQLCQKANILLPNVTEAALLTGLPYCQNAGLDDCKKLIDGLKSFGADGIVITGVSLSPDTVGFVGWENGEIFSYQTPKCAVQSHGTGDLFAAVVAGAMAKGERLQAAAKLAADFIFRVLSGTKKVSPFGADFENQLPFLWERAKNS